MLQYVVVLLLTLAVFGRGAKAQGIHIDIGVEHLESDQIQLWVISDSTWTGYLSSIQWTLRWEEASNATLGEFVASSSVPFLDGALQSGPTAIAGGYHHALYSVVPGQNSTSFIADQPFLLGTFSIIDGPANFEIADDAWTVANNGDFYISLNGHPSTGAIVELTTQVVSTVQLTHATLFPNPTNSSSLLTFELEQSGTVEIRVIDPSGRLVKQNNVAANAGTFRYSMSSGSMAEGAYTLQMVGPGVYATIPWMVIR